MGNSQKKLLVSEYLNSEENYLIRNETNQAKNQILDNINFVNKIDFDVLFKLNYNLTLNFNHELIIEIIQKLLKNEQLLQIQIDNIIEEKIKIVERLEKELKNIYDKLIDKNIIIRIESQIEDSKIFFKLINIVYLKLNEINHKLNTHEKSINDLFIQLEKLHKIDTSLLEKKIQEIMNELEKLKEDFKKTENKIINKIESITKKFIEGDEFLQKQIDESKNYIKDIQKKKLKP